MIEAVSFLELSKSVRKYAPSARALGLLFAPPGSPLVKREILPRLDDFHHLSGASIHFWCIGFSAYASHVFEDNTQVFTSVGGTPWDFSSQNFAEIVESVEERTTWRYRGDAELVMFNVKDRIRAEPILDFESVYCVDIATAIGTGQFSSVGGLFQSIFRRAREYDGPNFVAWLYSSGAVPSLGLTPQWAANYWTRATEAFAKRDFAALVHGCASLLEATAKAVVGTDSIMNQTLGSFIEAYRKSSKLDSERIDQILLLYRERNIMAGAGHGAPWVATLPEDRASLILKFTSQCVTEELGALTHFVGAIEPRAAA